MGFRVRLATEQDKLAAFSQHYSKWPLPKTAETLSEHLANCKCSAQYLRPRWYVGLVGEEVVCSLAAYPLEMLVEGKTAQAIGIGSVFTPEEHRRQGYAAKLITYVEDLEMSHGALFSLLFAEDKATYYSGLGYRECDSHLAVCSDPKFAKGLPLEPMEHPIWSELEDFHDGYHGTLAIHFVRSPGYNRYLAAKSPTDTWFWLGSKREAYGYLRLELTDDALILKDYALLNDSDALYGVMLASLISYAASKEVAEVRAWLPSRPMTRRFFTQTVRHSAHMMIKSLHPSKPHPLSPDILDDAAYIQPIHYF